MRRKSGSLMQLIQSSPSDIIHGEKYPFHNTVTSFPSFCNIKKQPKKPRLNFFKKLFGSNKSNWSFNEND